MNHATRKRIAKHLIDMASACGAVASLTDELPQYRCIRVEAHFEHVSVSIDIDSALGTGLMAHWYKADRNLRKAVFGSVNEFHFRKATTFKESIPDFEIEFGKLCEAVRDGTAFEPA